MTSHDAPILAVAQDSSFQESAKLRRNHTILQSSAGGRQFCKSSRSVCKIVCGTRGHSSRLMKLDCVTRPHYSLRQYPPTSTHSSAPGHGGIVVITIQSGTSPVLRN